MEQRIASPWTTDRIIETIQDARSSRIKALLQQPALEEHLELTYETFGLSAVKMEFLKRDLQLLADTPLDLVHYSAFIRKVKESEHAPDPQTLEEFIHAEVRPVFLKYITVTK